MATNRIALLLAFVLLFACKKADLPVPTTGTPLFYFNGNVNNQPVTLTAGVNNYYLFTTSTLNKNNIILLNGQLKDQQCTGNCPPALTISIADYKKRNTSINDISTVLKNTGYKYYLKDSVLYDTFKGARFSAEGGYHSYLWDFGDGDTSTLQNPVHVFTGSYTNNVCLTVDNGKGCTKTLCNKVNPSTPPADDLSFSITQKGDSVNLKGPNGWDSYFWELSDSVGSAPTTQNVTHIYKTGALYDVCLLGKKNGLTKSFCREINVPDNYNCSADWSYVSFDSLVPKQDAGYSQVIIEWTDANGKKYNSSLQQQPAASYFTIKSGSNYLDNAGNQKTYQFKCNFDVILFDETNPSNQVHVNSSNCNWGVAYP